MKISGGKKKKKTTIKTAEVKTAIQTSLLLFSVLVFLFFVDKIDSQDFSQSPHKGHSRI